MWWKKLSAVQMVFTVISLSLLFDMGKNMTCPSFYVYEFL